jgi:hypothetical protein
MERGFFPGDKAAGGVKLTTFLQLVPEVKKTWICLNPLPHYVFMA